MTSSKVSLLLTPAVCSNASIGGALLARRILRPALNGSRYPQLWSYFQLEKRKVEWSRQLCERRSKILFGTKVPDRSLKRSLSHFLGTMTKDSWNKFCFNLKQIRNNVQAQGLGLPSAAALAAVISDDTVGTEDARKQLHSLRKKDAVSRCNGKLPYTLYEYDGSYKITTKYYLCTMCAKKFPYEEESPVYKDTCCKCAAQHETVRKIENLAAIPSVEGKIARTQFQLSKNVLHWSKSDAARIWTGSTQNQIKALFKFKENVQLDDTCVVVTNGFSEPWYYKAVIMTEQRDYVRPESKAAYAYLDVQATPKLVHKFEEPKVDTEKCSECRDKISKPAPVTGLCFDCYEDNFRYGGRY